MQTSPRLCGLLILVMLSTLTIAPAAVTGVAAAPAAAASAADPADATTTGGLLFIENAGQWNEAARFQIWGGGPGTTWLAADAQWITRIEPAEEVSEIDGPAAMADPVRLAEADTGRAAVNLRLSFVDANPDPAIEPLGDVETHVSYFIGSNPDAWQTGVPAWGGVRYVDLYPGLDLEITSENGEIVRRLVAKDDAGVAALADVRLRIEGAESLALDGAAVQAATPLGDVAVPLLQVVNTNGVAGIAALGYDAAPGAPTIDGDIVTAPYTNEPATVDNEAVVQEDAAGPDYATFFGGSESDYIYRLFVDDQGAAYLAGATMSTDFPATAGPGYDTSPNGSNDAFMIKLAADGMSLEYATFLGGSSAELAYGIAVDDTGAVYLAGMTYSTDFPVSIGSGYDISHNGRGDAFVVKLAAGGLSLDYATYLGGKKADYVYGLALDSAGAVYLMGKTDSTDFPARSGPGYDTSHNGNDDAYVLKLAANGQSLVYATFLGGSSYDYGNGLDIDDQGAAYVTGYTYSSDFPAASGPGYDTSFAGGPYDAYAVKVAADGLSLEYATFLGGSGSDVGSAIAVDNQGAAYVTGMTTSDDFPAILGPGYDTSTSGTQDAYVLKLAADGQSLDYATFLGGTAAESGYSIAVDATGIAFLAGFTSSSDFPAAAMLGYDPSYNGSPYDAFFAKLSADGESLLYATFLGGSKADTTVAIDIDAQGAVYVSGATESDDFPAATGPGYDTTHNGKYDAFMIKLMPQLGTWECYIPVIRQGQWTP